MDGRETRAVVRRTYAEAARRARSGGGCCGEAAPGGGRDPITAGLYAAGERTGVPAEALTASLGCGNPTALADLRAGEVVLDLGSGGGLDVLLSARRVGPTGKAYGLDMTDEMLALARENLAKAGIGNVEFLRGEMEEIPLPDASVDVVISNCVINLCADKDRVLAEAFRVLRSGGRLAVSDIVSRGPMPEAIRRSLELWAGCVAGALEESDYRARLERAGFRDVSLEPTRIFRAGDGRAALRGLDIDPEELDGRVMAAFVRARKPAAAP